MTIILTAREQQLVAACRRVGYRVEVGETNITLHGQPVGRWAVERQLPYLFRSIQAAAEHLVPIVRDEEFSKEVTPPKECDHNEMLERKGDDKHAWQCAKCGYIYGQ